VTRGRLFLVPNLLGVVAPETVLPARTIAIARSLGHYVVENAKPARAFLKTLAPDSPLRDMHIVELGESPSIVDRVATEVLKMPRPPLREIDAVGTAALLDDLAETNRLLGDQPLPAPESLLAMARHGQTFY
jgi:16S rRNA (cytidine1402-2'-O)-methyltransferase